MKILISGAGIAGSTLAYWLAHYGFEPTLVEVAPQLRTGGYIIDFWGAGFEIADRMGLLLDLNRLGYRVKEVRVVNRAGKRVAGFPADSFGRITRGRYTSIPRSDLAASIFRTVEGRAETIFGDSVTGMEQDEKGVHVTFRTRFGKGLRLGDWSRWPALAHSRVGFWDGKPVREISRI